MAIDSAHNDWLETYKSLISFSTEGFKFCALVNGGAAVAILAYLGNVAGKNGTVPDMRCAMAAFLLGLFSCGVAMLFAYLTQLTRLNQLSQNLDTRKDWHWWVAVFFIAVSLISFACGSWFAVVTFK